MPTALLTRDEVLECLTTTFRRFGYDGATLSRLEAFTGLKRSSLYHHFPAGKEEMAREVLAHANRWLQVNVIEPLQTPGDPQRKIDAMCAALASFYASGKESCLLNVMCFGDARDLFQDSVKQAMRQWITALSHPLIASGVGRAEATRRAEDAIRDIQGALVMSRTLNSTQPFHRTLAELTARMLRP